MNKELEALERINHIYYYDENINDGETISIDLEEICKEDLDIIENGLKRKEKLEKAFELIKNKKVDVWYEIMLSVTYDDYLDQKTDLSEELTEEEYELLEEMLG